MRRKIVRLHLELGHATGEPAGGLPEMTTGGTLLSAVVVYRRAQPRRRHRQIAHANADRVGDRIGDRRPSAA
jgi:hypothetical protein